MSGQHFEFLKSALNEAGVDPVKAAELDKQWAPTYDEDAATLRQGKPPSAHLVDKMAALITDHEASTILDLGCETGIAGERFHRYGFKHVDALDGVKEMLDVAHTTGLYRQHIEQLLCPDTKIPVEDNTYHAILSAGVFLCHVSGAVFPELVRITKPGGVIIFDAWIHTEEQRVALNDHTQKLVNQGKWVQLEHSVGQNHFTNVNRNCPEQFVFRVC